MVKKEGILMHVSLTPELETLVKKHVKTGRYHSSSEVVREALRVWEEQEQLRELRRNQLRKGIQAGLESGDATPLDFEDIKKRGRTRLKQAAKER
jgi:antitoxin ParD1/3/4